MEQLTKNQAVATSQEAVQNQNEPQLRDENAHNDKSVHGVLNPTYQAGLRRDAVQPDIEAERKKRDEIEAGKKIGRAVQQECPRPISYAVFCLNKRMNRVCLRPNNQNWVFPRSTFDCYVQRQYVVPVGYEISVSTYHCRRFDITRQTPYTFRLRL